MKVVLAQVVLILLVSVFLSGASYFLRPDTIPWEPAAHEVDVDGALALDGALWIDARLSEDFERAHYAGSLLLNEEDWESGLLGLLEVWDGASPIVVYCSSQSCMRSHQVAARLREELASEEVFALRGGWEALLEAGIAKEGAR